MSSILNSIVTVNGETIDFSKIYRVGPINHTDATWSQYTVYFTGGDKLEICDKQTVSDDPKMIGFIIMERYKFIELWRIAKNKI